jgi:mono/diheme cytochrome c family protein
MPTDDVTIDSTLEDRSRSGGLAPIAPQIGFAPVTRRPATGAARLAITIALALAAALGGAGCNKNSANVNQGKALFSARCSTCHQLADVGPGGGTQGPNLDDAFHAARLAGMDSDTIAGIVKAQVENPRPSGQNPSDSMPADLASGQDLDDIAAYVGAVAGTGIKPPKIPGGRGGQVFVTAQPTSCSSCHTLAAAHASATTGPNLDDVIPSMSTAEIKQSIVNPNAKITSGFSPGIMPSTFGQTISGSDLTALVKFLQKYAGKTSGASSSAAATATTPTGGGSGASKKPAGGAKKSG